MAPNRIRQAGGDGARQAAWLFMAAGVIGLITDAVPGSPGYGQLSGPAMDAGVVTVGLCARFVPWERWPTRTALVMPVLALADLSLNLSQGLLPLATYGVWLVLVFVWIGQWQPPFSAVAMGPVAALAFCIPFAFGTPIAPGAISAIVLSVLVAVLVGETISRKERRSQLAQAGQREALELLAVANLTDDLTGLGNRRRANALLDSLQDGDALAILDLDHFKQVNDSLGHLRGDEVLQQLGSYLKEAVRGADDVARFGGEEFLVVLRGAGSSAAPTIQRLLDGWRATGPITTLSAGIAIHRSTHGFDQTFADADAALYDAKDQGRDRLVVRPVVRPTETPNALGPIAV